VNIGQVLWVYEWDRIPLAEPAPVCPLCGQSMEWIIVPSLFRDEDDVHCGHCGQWMPTEKFFSRPRSPVRCTGDMIWDLGWSIFLHGGPFWVADMITRMGRRLGGESPLRRG
jgi:hypothetical protein